MTEDDGYETIVPDLSVVEVEQVDREAVAEHARNKWKGEDIYTAFARHRQAAYNQALKDAAALARKSRNYDDDLHRRAGAMTCGERISSAILSLGDKGNG